MANNHKGLGAAKTRRLSQPAFPFDLDGTLLDTVYEHVAAWSKALISAGIAIPEWKIHRRIGMSGHSMVPQLPAEHRQVVLKKKTKVGRFQLRMCCRRLPGCI